MRTCSECGAKNLDYALYCKDCGIDFFPIEKNIESIVSIDNEKNIKGTNVSFIFHIIICIVGIIFGAFVFIVGVVEEGGGHGTDYTRSLSFGADFYTEIYEATRTAANNLCDLNSSICCLGFILKMLTIGFGGFIMLFSTLNMVRMISRKKYENVILQQNRVLYALFKEQLKKEQQPEYICKVNTVKE